MKCRCVKVSLESGTATLLGVLPVRRCKVGFDVCGLGEILDVGIDCGCTLWGNFNMIDNIFI